MMILEWSRLDCPHWLGHKTYFSKLREAGIQFTSHIENNELHIRCDPNDEAKADAIMIDCLSGRFINVEKLDEKLRPFIKLGWED